LLIIFFNIYNTLVLGQSVKTKEVVAEVHEIRTNDTETARPLDTRYEVFIEKGHESSVPIAAEQAYINDYVNKLDRGSLIFNPPKEMTVNITETINATITQERGLGEAIKVAPIMEVELKGRAFSIDPLTKMRQFVAPDDFHEAEKRECSIVSDSARLLLILAA